VADVSQLVEVDHLHQAGQPRVGFLTLVYLGIERENPADDGSGQQAGNHDGQNDGCGNIGINEHEQTPSSCGRFVNDEKN
jgi:hypothetical protein